MVEMTLKMWLLLPALLILVEATELAQLSNLLGELPRQLDQQPDSFDAWTAQLAGNLSSEQQQRLAQNVRWLRMPKNAMQLQQLLAPSNSNSNSNSLKLQLWLSFYWQLRRDRQLDRILLPHFAWSLRQVHESGPWDVQLQNMLQSLPTELRFLVTSERVCIQHAEEHVYVGLLDQQLELGASNCSLWRVLPQQHGWLRLENDCEDRFTLFVNVLQQHVAHTYMLLTEPSSRGRSYCAQQRLGFYMPPLEARAPCYWQLNDCALLPSLLAANKM